MSDLERLFLEHNQRSNAIEDPAEKLSY